MPNDLSQEPEPEPGDPGLPPAVERLRADGLVAFPTETVWGLAACGESIRAIARLLRWKGRDEGQPISLLVSGPSALAPYGFTCTELAQRLMRELWPGALTLVLPCTHEFAPGIAAAGGAVGVRCSSHPLASALARAAERAGLGALTATSLNRSGQPPARSHDQARALCADGPDAPWVLEAGENDAFGERPSTVLDLTGAQPVVLRWGGVGPRELDALGVGHRAMDPHGDDGEKIG